MGWTKGDTNFMGRGRCETGQTRLKMGGRSRTDLPVKDPLRQTRGPLYVRRVIHRGSRTDYPIKDESPVERGSAQIFEVFPIVTRTEGGVTEKRVYLVFSSNCFLNTSLFEPGTVKTNRPGVTYSHNVVLHKLKDL